MAVSKAFVFDCGFAHPIAEHREVACSEDQAPCNTVADA